MPLHHVAAIVPVDRAVLPSLATPVIELPVACSGTGHTLRWDRGTVTAVAHPDLDAERALVAFGGEPPACLELLDLWEGAVLDGGFLGEWFDDDFDQARLWWLRMALERMKNEGFHEFLRELPLVRAQRMGQFLSAFPSPWIDRAAVAHASGQLAPDTSGRQTSGPAIVPDERTKGLLALAAARRLRRSFVMSVGGTQLPLGAAALVRLTLNVTGSTPRIGGVLAGRASRISIETTPRWLVEVWGVGAAVIDGHLVLDLDHATGDAAIVRWIDDAQPVVEHVQMRRGFDRWMPR